MTLSGEAVEARDVSREQFYRVAMSDERLPGRGSRAAVILVS